MPQQVNVSNFSEESPAEETGMMTPVQLLGYILAFSGWVLFACGVMGLFFPPTTPDTQAPSGTEHSFINAGYFLVPAWLLLRLAAGLFPFFSNQSGKTLP
jgi:hypothetical protein